MKTPTLLAAVALSACSVLATVPAHAAPRPNLIVAECEDGTYTAKAGSPMTVSAHGVDPDGRPVTFSVKAAEDYPAFNGVPRDLLTRCDVYINGEYFVDGYLLLTGPGR